MLLIEYIIFKQDQKTDNVKVTLRTWGKNNI